MIKNTLADKSGSLESLWKKSQQFESSSTRVHIIGEDLLMAFYKLFYLQFCDSSDNTVKQRYKKFGRYFYKKIIVTVTPTYLVTNLLLSHFWPFSNTKNQNQNFRSWWSGNKKCFCDSNKIWTCNHLVRKQTLNHLVKLAKWFECML